jgi:hypothetical protein
MEGTKIMQCGSSIEVTCPPRLGWRIEKGQRMGKTTIVYETAVHATEVSQKFPSKDRFYEVRP